MNSSRIVTLRIRQIRMNSLLRQLNWLFKVMESWCKSLSKDQIPKIRERTTTHSQCHHKKLTKKATTFQNNNLCQSNRLKKILLLMVQKLSPLQQTKNISSRQFLIITGIIRLIKCRKFSNKNKLFRSSATSQQLESSKYHLIRPRRAFQRIGMLYGTKM